MSSNDILVIDNLSKIYHTNNSEITAIKDLNLNIKDGEFVAIVGPSGCGKTTLLSILCGLENKSSGNILFPKGKAKMGYMLQNDTLFPWLNILDNSLLGLRVQKKITKENKDKVISMLNTYGLKDFIYKYPSNLSGGMKQRPPGCWAAIMTALSGAPTARAIWKSSLSLRASPSSMA